jgi:hypothetical protein
MPQAPEGRRPVDVAVLVSRDDEGKLYEGTPRGCGRRHDAARRLLIA